MGCNMVWSSALAVGRESKAASCAHVPVTRFEGGSFTVHPDSIVQEEEFRVVVNGVCHHEMTCSPWDIRELVVRNLFLSGVIQHRDQVRSVEIDRVKGIVAVEVSACSLPVRPVPRTEVYEGAVVVTGLFDGAVLPNICESRAARPLVSPAEINKRIALLEDRSLLFRRTGGVHSAVLIDDGGVVAWFEDIGRHSAVDKLAGWCFLNDVDVTDKMLLFSGRVPREIIVKVIRLGCPLVASPGAPTTLSIQLAERAGVTLVGFAKHGAFNVYTHPERIG